MGFGIFLVHKVHVVRTYQLDIVFFGIFNQFFIHHLLHGIHLMIGTCHRRLVTLQFQVVVISEKILVPADGLFCLFKLSGRDTSGHFPSQTSRTYNQSFVILLQFRTVCTRTHVESLGPRLRHQFNQVMITLQILGQHHQVIPALVRLTFLILQTATGYIHFTTENWFEQLLFRSLQLFLASCNLRFGVFRLFLTTFQSGNFLLQILNLPIRTPVLLVDIVEELLDAEHISVVGHCDSSHAVGHSFVYQPGNRSLSVKNRILRMNVQMNKILHEYQC